MKCTSGPDDEQKQLRTLPVREEAGLYLLARSRDRKPARLEAGVQAGEAHMPSVCHADIYLGRRLPRSALMRHERRQIIYH
jgi:hypothetical protein